MHKIVTSCRRVLAFRVLAAAGAAAVIPSCASSPAWTSRLASPVPEPRADSGEPEQAGLVAVAGSATTPPRRAREHPSAALPDIADPVPGERSDPMNIVTLPGADASLTPAHADAITQVTTSEDGADFDPSVSRDGSFVVYASTQHRTTADLYRRAVGSRAVTQLTSDPAQDVMPAVSPDGSRIAFASNRSGSWDIFVMNAKGGQAVQVTSDPGAELHPTWSPDGTRIAFCRLSQSSGRWELWIIDAGDAAAAEFIGYGLFPDWCPIAGRGADGRDQILFQRARERGSRAYSIWTVDYAPGQVSSPTELVAIPGLAAINPVWAPDGRSIAFSTVAPDATRPGILPSAADLWIASADGSERVNLTAGQGVSMQPRWAKDGRLYFVSNRSGRDNLWSIGTAGALAAMRQTTGEGAPASAGSSPPAQASADDHN
ncbi:MAG: PD40 domain-containing protein [Phycisphaerae bacterium]|nr:PD40 domain-containing protein [Phycisphaerae bacterium]